jgi:hypothetical protein
MLLMTSIEGAQLSDQRNVSDRLLQLSHGSPSSMGFSKQCSDSWPTFSVCKTYWYSLEVDHEDSHSGKNIWSEQFIVDGNESFCWSTKLSSPTTSH